MRNKKLVMNILWTLAAVYAVATLANALFSLSIPVPLLLLVSVAFALIHGAVRYRWSGMVTFIIYTMLFVAALATVKLLQGHKDTVG